MHYTQLSTIVMATNKAHCAGQKQVAIVERWHFICSS